MWIHPFSHQRKTVPEDITEIEQVGRKALNALESVYGTKYRFGTGADILYPSSGGSDDWAKGKGGAKYVYLMELRPGEEVWDGFILDSRQLIPTGRETWAGIKVVIEAVLNLRRGNCIATQMVWLYTQTFTGLERHVTCARISKTSGLRVPFYFPCDCCCAAMTAMHLPFDCYSIADRERERRPNSK
ncbi:hypothetical protein Y032_0008g70 [Ancylostoma ceylanicum]|uniref:Peptidase M14 domain-containing protein n=1 Tax=Ancylostoma ceylanicum TaxID=53326 RepID=A0A016VML3_9BILA|nr:hypothetical protein Y032_0008g70 [Ancylostoma ceylanicum]